MAEVQDIERESAEEQKALTKVGAFFCDDDWVKSLSTK